MSNNIAAGSNSRLNVFEDCRLRAKLAFIDKIPEPEKPPRKDGKEDPMERGSRIHTEAENYVKGNTDILVPELNNFKDELNAARILFQEGKAFGEENWNFDENWQPLPDPFTSSPPDWDTFHKVRFRIKTDLTVFTSDKSILIVDYKTGRKYGNEIKHGEQLELYAIGGFLIYDDVETITTELWYSDINDIVRMTFTKNEAYQRLAAWNERNKAMITCNEFPPNPSIHTCKWCPYRTDRSGHCSVGVF